MAADVWLNSSLVVALSADFHVAFTEYQFALQNSPYSKVLRKAGNSSGAIPSKILEDPAVKQLTHAICRHNGRSAVRQLHDSAASEYCAYADQLTNRVKFLTRLDTANINEAVLIYDKAAEKPAEEQAERAFAQLPPFEARKAFLLGAPRAACCPERSKTAEGIQKLRNTTDGEIGIAHALCTVLFVLMVGAFYVGGGCSISVLLH